MIWWAGWIFVMMPSGYILTNYVAATPTQIACERALTKYVDNRMPQFAWCERRQEPKK
jgi:hypothetical protein